MRGVALNFFPLKSHDFTFRLFYSPFVEGARPSVGEEKAVRRSLEVGGKRDFYWTLSQEHTGSGEIECGPFDNTYATIDLLRAALIGSCHDGLPLEDVDAPQGFRRRVEIVLARHREGEELLSVEPYFLRSKRLFGFLVDFRFRPGSEHRHSRRASELSLSLDKSGRENLNYYADRYGKLSDFVARIHPAIFPLVSASVLGRAIGVSKRLVELRTERLDLKRYVVGAESEARSQFMGVKTQGPLERGPSDSCLYFLYRREDRALSHSLYRALEGRTFRTFPGMGEMFGLDLSRRNVMGQPLNDFGPVEVDRVRDEVLARAEGRPVVPIVLTPFSRRDDPDENRAYWKLKHAFLSAGLPIQVVSTATVADRNVLKWSTAGIGLQIFAKAGGTPWKVRPRTERCLIVGIGQAHRRDENDRIRRFYAYSVLADSSGVFEEVRVLGDGEREEGYLEDFTASLDKILDDYGDRFVNFVVHTTFAIRRNELERIQMVLAARRKEKADGAFVALKFDRRSRFFGFAAAHNSRVPHESTLVALSRGEFLVWFEGLQYGRSTLTKRIGRPLYARFTYPDDLSADDQRAHLQDALNLSGANWRGFNAKAEPVSVYYAQLIARYISAFETQGLPPVDVNIPLPWFL